MSLVVVLIDEGCPHYQALPSRQFYTTKETNHSTANNITIQIDSNTKSTYLIPFYTLPKLIAASFAHKIGLKKYNSGPRGHTHFILNSQKNWHLPLTNAMVPLQYVQTFFVPIQFHRPIFSFFNFFGSTSFTGFQLISKIYFNPILTLPSQFKLVSTPIVSKICQKIGATSTFFLSIQMEPLFPVVCLLHCRVGQFFFKSRVSKIS